jgi:hypothetical protein
MPYFPTSKESAYRCQGCGQWFIPSGVSCCVAHAPGTCCHMGETPVVGMDGLKPADFNAKSKPGTYAIPIETPAGEFLRVQVLPRKDR